MTVWHLRLCHSNQKLFSKKRVLQLFARNCCQSAVSPVAYIAQHELPWWHKIKLVSNTNLLILPNTSVTQFLTTGTGNTKLADGDQTMSIWLASRGECPPSTMQAWPDVSTWVKFEKAASHLSVTCIAPESSLSDLRNASGQPFIVLHVPLKTSIDMETQGIAAVRDIECDNIGLKSAAGNCEVYGVKVSNKLLVEATGVATSDGSTGCINMAGTIQGTCIVAKASQSVAVNRILAQEVDICVDIPNVKHNHQTCSLTVASLYAQSVRLRCNGKVDVHVLSGEERCRVSAHGDVSLGNLRGGDISVASRVGSVRCSLDEWRTACFTSHQGKTHVTKPFSDQLVALDELPHYFARPYLFDYLAVKDS